MSRGKPFTPAASKSHTGTEDRPLPHTNQQSPAIRNLLRQQYTVCRNTEE